ncbi:rhodanese-like domain-containing protein [Mycobacterium sp. MYCO198283]|uniref:rhodanese-like domain-containing protein n=1 Tax=Mycobacterium sp. MYCO198283 TaxID=2883505 RepID=UPI001E4A8F45|nr:rhodanese-like domain-containing protein [Mycobacterium sp. MYCO198283]MCG5433008.1 rhodanese-like domain-containing protein [Mycobacterium sp. MYCO198283]
MGAESDRDVRHVGIDAVPATVEPPAVLLDVREPDEWRRGHAPGALHIPMGEVPARLHEIDRDAELFVVCMAGGRSLKVAEYLRTQGYEPANVTGGMLAWAAAGRPVVTDDGSPGAV